MPNKYRVLLSMSFEFLHDLVVTQPIGVDFLFQAGQRDRALAAGPIAEMLRVDDPETPLADVGRVDRILILFREEREAVEVGVARGLVGEYVRLRIPGAERCQTGSLNTLSAPKTE